MEFLFGHSGIRAEFSWRQTDCRTGGTQNAGLKARRYNGGKTQDPSQKALGVGTQRGEIQEAGAVPGGRSADLKFRHYIGDGIGIAATQMVMAGIK